MYRAKFPRIQQVRNLVEQRTLIGNVPILDLLVVLSPCRFLFDGNVQNATGPLTGSHWGTGFGRRKTRGSI